MSGSDHSTTTDLSGPGSSGRDSTSDCEGFSFVGSPPNTLPHAIRSRMLTVALLNHNGHLGGAIYEALLPLVQHFRIALVVLHRPDSDISSIPPEVETRELDLERRDLTHVRTAVQGINVVISALPLHAISSQKILVEALTSHPTLLTFIPSDFSPWQAEAEDVDDNDNDHVDDNDDDDGPEHRPHRPRHPQLQFLVAKERIAQLARARGVPLTIVRSGVFVHRFLENRSWGIDIWANRMAVYDSAMIKEWPLTTIEYLAASLCQLLSHPSKLPNRTFTSIQFLPTGDDLARILSSLHGSAPKLEGFTDAEYARDLDRGIEEVLAAEVKRGFGAGWDWESVGIAGRGSGRAKRLGVEGWRGDGLEGIMRRYLEEDGIGD